MSKVQQIGIVGDGHKQSLPEVVRKVNDVAIALGRTCICSTDLQDVVTCTDIQFAPEPDLIDTVDLIVVIGGDGSMLRVAPAANEQGVAVCGINLGRVGALTDIHIDKFESELTEILQGRYHLSERMMLQLRWPQQNEWVSVLNELVVHSPAIAQMIEIEVNQGTNSIYNLRADGLVVATPTGSTGYAMSAQGSVVHPDLAAIVLVPLLPMAGRPGALVIPPDEEIHIKLSANSRRYAQLTCDGHTESVRLQAEDVVQVRVHANKLQLWQPISNNYYDVIHTKLEWHGINGVTK